MTNKALLTRALNDGVKLAAFLSVLFLLAVMRVR